MVAGPSGYNPKKLDHSDMILRLSAEFVEWFKDLESQIQRPESEDSKRASLLRTIEFADSRPELDPTASLAELADGGQLPSSSSCLKLCNRSTGGRKNSNIYKLYLASKEGKVKEIRPEVFFENADLTAFTEGTAPISASR